MQLILIHLDMINQPNLNLSNQISNALYYQALIK